ncbi:MAG: hypothetical protein J7623_07350 [Chitinophaga sp.]|uniref:hypothetical protein n=1 Tax=Chitinophaga sp. TaxID=1869181 RepID=UPI001B2C2FF9|nr:hypothetical protein [Chitinophaga sp.]MBO9728440.1 hypothetical protein [Chitinophaga sp.]
MATSFKENLSSRTISPAGMITLPPAARHLLKFQKGQGKRIGFSVEKDKVTLYPTATDKRPFKEVSARGLMKLNQAAGAILKNGHKGAGKYLVKLDEKDGNVGLYPHH